MPELYSIGEGEGELEALPELLRRISAVWFDDYTWRFPTPARATRAELARPGGLEHFVARAARARPGAILILLDTDGNHCPCELACDLAVRVAAVGSKPPVAVVCADQEYEAWFAASAAALRGVCGLPSNLAFEGDPDAMRSPKGWISRQMLPAVHYREVKHQVVLTAHLDVHEAHANSRSFRRLIHALEELRQAYTTGRTIYTPIPRKDSPNP